MKSLRHIKIDFISALFCTLILTVLFLIIPHYVELTGVMETWFMHNGLTYYKEFPAYHFPFGRLILYPLHLFTNWNLEWDPVLALVIGIINIFLIYKFGKNNLTSFGTSLALIFFSLLYWYFANGIIFYHEILIGLLLTIILYILFEIFNTRRVNPKTLIILGLLISTAELSGQLATLTLSLIGIVILFLILKYEKRNILKSFLIFFAGILIPIVTTLIYFLIKGGLYEFYFYNIPYYLFYASYEKGNFFDLPLNDILTFYLPLIVLFLSYLFSRKIFPNLKILFFYLLSLSTIPFIIFSFFHPHHFSYALPIQALILGFTFDQQRSHNLSKIIFILGCLYLIFYLFSHLLPWYTSRISNDQNMRIKNDIYDDSKDPMKDAISWVIANTKTEDKLMVFGDAMFYLRANRLPSARPSKGIPYGWNPMKQIEMEVKNSRPKFWIIDRRFLNRMRDYFNRNDIYLFLSKELDECYTVKKIIDNWEIWEMNSINCIKAYP